MMIMKLNNPGRTKANEAAKAVNGIAIFPSFLKSENKTDFNDMLIEQGKKVLNDYIQGAIKQALMHPVDKSLGNNIASLEAANRKIQDHRFKLIPVAELIENPAPISWVIRRYIEGNSIGLLFGESGAGKSFCAIDMGLCVATGKKYQGNDVCKGAVIYIGGEGHNGIPRRLKAWELHYGISLIDVQFYVSNCAASLYDMSSVYEVIEAVSLIVQQIGENPMLIIIDTLARNFGAANESSSEDMGQFINHVETYLKYRFEVTVLISTQAKLI